LHSLLAGFIPIQALLLLASILALTTLPGGWLACGSLEVLRITFVKTLCTTVFFFPGFPDEPITFKPPLFKL